MNLFPPGVNVGDTVVYESPSGGHALKGTVTGEGKRNGLVVLFLEDGTWCYLHHVVQVVERKKP